MSWSRNGRRHRGAAVAAAVGVLSVAVVLCGPAATGGSVGGIALAADTAQPRAQAFSPPAGAVDVSVEVEPWVRFSEEIDAASLTSSTLYIHAAGGGPAVPATIEYRTSGSNRATIATILPLQHLEDGVAYEVVVTTGITDLAGNPLESSWSWTFSVVETIPDVFVDVQPGGPYYDAIWGMYQAEVIDGYDGPQGREFRPNNPIWRQQFAKMVCGAFEVTVTEDMTSPFTDLEPDNPGSLYPNEYIAAAWARGITMGKTLTTFGPYDNISRAQVVTMGVRALETVAPGVLQEPPAGYTNTWGVGFSATHGPYARVAEYNGMLAGLGMDASHPGGSLAGLEPWGDMPRGEVAQFLWNARALLP